MSPPTGLFRRPATPAASQAPTHCWPNLARSSTLAKVYLDQWLSKNLEYSPLYRGGLSNHLSMALVALHRLGAPEERLEAFFQRYAPRLEPRKDPIQLRTLEDVADLAKGIGAAAFHGLIRTAYALEAGHPGEIQAGLDAWATSYLPLGETQQPIPSFPIEGLQGDTIHERMQQVAQHPEFQNRCTTQGATASLAEIRELALRTYARANGDFTALHLVTAVHAFRVVEANTPLPIPPFLAAVSAAIMTITHAKGPGDAQPVTVPWPSILEKALASNDDHTIKFIYTCQQEEAFTQDPRYRTLAAHRVKLHPSLGS